MKEEFNRNKYQNLLKEYFKTEKPNIISIQELLKSLAFIWQVDKYKEVSYLYKNYYLFFKEKDV